MRYRFGTTSEPHLRAQIIPTLSAGATIIAGYTYFERHYLANVKAIYIRASGDDYTCRFVAKRQRRDRLEVTVSEILVVCNIAAAEAGPFDGNLKFVGRRIGNGSCFLK